ncbi:MAG: tetratricopeptide repeat protein [bacterium]
MYLITAQVEKLRLMMAGKRTVSIFTAITLRPEPRPPMPAPRKKSVCWVLCSVFCLLSFMIGCLTTGSLRQGRKLLSEGEYDRATEVLTNALKEEPDNPEIYRDMGIAYYKLGQYNQALDKLEKAKQGLPKDSRLIFYMGLVYEKLEKYDQAIEEYSNYTRLSPLSRVRRKIKERLPWLIRQEADRWAKARLKDEENLPVQDIPDTTVAVTYFKPLTVLEGYESLHLGLTDLLITDLSLVKSLSVVERIKLHHILDELGFSSTDLVDQSKAPRMGKLLGASILVTGVFTALEEKVQIEPALGKVKLDKLYILEGVEGMLANFLQIEKDLVWQVLDEMGLELTSEEREAISRNVPTESLAAFLAYSTGLSLEDSGMYPEAAKEYESALTLDPNFNEAVWHLKEVQSLTQVESGDSMEQIMEAALSTKRLQDEALATTVETISRQGTSIPRSEPDMVNLDIILRWDQD